MKSITEKQMLHACQQADYEVAGAARSLGVSRQALYRRMEASSLLETVQQLDMDRIEKALQAAGGDVIEAARQLKVSPTGLKSRLQQAGLLPGGSKRGD